MGLVFSDPAEKALYGRQSYRIVQGQAATAFTPARTWTSEQRLSAFSGIGCASQIVDVRAVRF
jgi:hypothetical protein